MYSEWVRDKLPDFYEYAEKKVREVHPNAQIKSITVENIGEGRMVSSPLDSIQVGTLLDDETGDVWEVDKILTRHGDGGVNVVLRPYDEPQVETPAWKRGLDRIKQGEKRELERRRNLTPQDRKASLVSNVLPTDSRAYARYDAYMEH